MDTPTPPPIAVLLPELPPLPLPPEVPLLAVAQATKGVDPPPKQIAPNASVERPFTFTLPPLPTLI